MAVKVIITGILIATIFILGFLTPGIYYSVNPDKVPTWFKMNHSLITAGVVGLVLGIFVAAMGFFVE